MCGIAGFIDPKLSKEESQHMVTAMLESIAHRGPDARGLWNEMPVVFGHNRLSIIDLSAEGNQPMEYFDSVIIYNGEIYNYIEVRNELKAKGYIFKTQSDTEVILAAYREYGENCVQRFVGMWAFALWDKKEKILFCSRDRFGIKPFYYIHDGDRFYFGSEFKALKKTPLFSNELNLAQVNRGLQLGWVCYRDETYFKKITALPAAYNLKFNPSNSKLEIEKYWNIDLTKKYSGSAEEKKEKFYQLFADSIKFHMRSDVEVGGCLSGGLDSSAIASGVSTLFSEARFKTFTVYYQGKDEVDERPWVSHVLKKYPSLTPYYFTPTDEQIRESFARFIYHADVPVPGSSPFSQYFLMQLAASEKIKVLLDGQGSDEMMAGYMHSFYRLLGSYISSFRVLKYAREILSLSFRQKYNLLKIANVKLKSLLTIFLSEQKLYELEYKNYYPFLSKDNSINFSLDSVDGSRLNKFLYHLIFTTSLPTLLQYEDRNSMAFSIESRVPFLDHRLVEFVFSLDDGDKISYGWTKYILRKSLSGILPSEITWRKDKKGFVTPGEMKWLRGPLKHLLDADFGAVNDVLDGSKAEKIISNFKNGENKTANLVWRLAVLNYWLSQNR